jgi:hypothetical protein
VETPPLFYFRQGRRGCRALLRRKGAATNTGNVRGDPVFSFNDTVLNGVAFYDLIPFRNNSAPCDNGKTELKVNNGQGWAQFVSPKINFNNVWFEHCGLPEGRDEQHKDIADVKWQVNTAVPHEDWAYWLKGR